MIAPPRRIPIHHTIILPLLRAYLLVLNFVFTTLYPFTWWPSLVIDWEDSMRLGEPIHTSHMLTSEQRGYGYEKGDYGNESIKEPFVQWTCLITDHIETTPPTPPGFCRLIVEGFPKRYGSLLIDWWQEYGNQLIDGFSAVEDGCAELLSVIRGDVIKCDKDEQWLLTGYGREDRGRSIS